MGVKTELKHSYTLFDIIYNACHTNKTGELHIIKGFEKIKLIHTILIIILIFAMREEFVII